MGAGERPGRASPEGRTRTTCRASRDGGGILAGWSMNIGAMFKGKGRKGRGADDGHAQPSAVVQPMVRGGHRPGAEKSLLPRFQTTASDQLNNRAGDRFAAIRSKLRHAFTPSQPVADRRMFAGREGVLRTIIGSIEDQRLHVV